ncbi:MAG: response regulator [Candidatus Sulfotelmatobacter sp.]|jgi:CheY-like chemotaxis protein
MARPRTILCIDDHRNALIGRKMLLENSGYAVLEATGGDEGLNLFRSHPVDAVVLDYQMPGMNGDVVAAKMKRIRSSVPIMLLSAYGPLPESKLKSVDTFVPKSQEPKMLISTLQHLLNSQSRPFFSRWLDHWRDRNQAVKL